jgi:hypothetical protein
MLQTLFRRHRIYLGYKTLTHYSPSEPFNIQSLTFSLIIYFPPRPVHLAVSSAPKNPTKFSSIKSASWRSKHFQSGLVIYRHVCLFSFIRIAPNVIKIIIYIFFYNILSMSVTLSDSLNMDLI